MAWLCKKEAPFEGQLYKILIIQTDGPTESPHIAQIGEFSLSSVNLSKSCPFFSKQHYWRKTTYWEYKKNLFAHSNGDLV